MSKACPPLKMDCKSDKYGVTCRARTSGGTVGQIHLSRIRDHDDLLEVRFIQIEKSSRRCGIGTKLYEEAARLAAEQGKRMASDTSRTRATQRFWEKQVEKGRAQCIQAGLAVKLNENLEQMRGRWKCKRFAMRTLKPGSLAGK